MTRPKQTSNKREKEKNRLKRRKEKEQRKEDRKKHSSKGLGLDTLVVEAIETEQVINKAQNNSDQPAAGAVKIGKVVYLNLPKNYGFIRDARVKETLFFITDNLKWEVSVNDLVTFTRTKSSRGGTATSIEKIV